MSSSSNYEPEEDEEASDSDFQSGHSNANRSAERPPSENRQNGTSRVSRSRAKKRTREMAFWDLRTKLTRESVGEYTALLAETTGDNAPTPTEIDDGDKYKYNTTQNGVVIWTHKEKETLFNVLDRKGKNGIKEIAKAIGSKSELEVQEHLRLLHRGLERQHLRDRHTRTIVLGDVPAASEVRDECDRVLDEYANLVSLEEQYAENVSGRQKHHGTWIIDKEKAKEINDEVEERTDGEEGKENQDIASTSTVHLTASLLNMEKWIRLSERFLMNFGGPRLEDNWANVAYPEESPSLTADAFTDFYALTLSVTRRLVQSSLFFAMSRLRKMRHTGHRKAQVVKSRDVRAALSVLNMKRNDPDYWVGLARRCNLDVVDSRHKKGWVSVPMNHNEVEDYLSGARSDDPTSDKKSMPGSQEHVINADSDSDSSVLSNVRSSPEPEPPLYLSLEDEHADTVDQTTNNLEERRLWGLLGRTPPADFEPYIKPEDENAQPQRPTGERKTKEDLFDWRDRIVYRSEWEEYEDEIHDVYEKLSENRRKRRRIAKEEPVRLVSPASTTSEVEEVDIEMNTDDEQEDTDPSAVKHEGQRASEDDPDDAMDVYGNSGKEPETDQNPIISQSNQGVDQNASRDSEKAPESQEQKPRRDASQQRIAKPDPSEDEGSESDDGSSKPEQNPNFTDSNPENIPTSPEYSDSVKDAKPVIQASSPPVSARIKPDSQGDEDEKSELESEYESDDAKEDLDSDGNDDEENHSFGQRQINPDYHSSSESNMPFYSSPTGWTKGE